MNNYELTNKHAGELISIFGKQMTSNNECWASYIHECVYNFYKELNRNKTNSFIIGEHSNAIISSKRLSKSIPIDDFIKIHIEIIKLINFYNSGTYRLTYSLSKNSMLISI